MKRIRQILASALLSSVITACGGGGNVADGGIGGTGISNGSISAFSSIVVNGTKFEVGAAVITVNGTTVATQDALDIGYVVRVDGDLDDGVAEEVRFEADLIGAVDTNGIPPGEAVGTLTIMQQTVRITPTTVLKLQGIDGPDMITASDRVLVSGYRDSSDTLIATHIELNPTRTTDQIVGRVDNSSVDSFEINGLKIDWNSEPEVGDLVVVRGDYDSDKHIFTVTPPIEELEDRFDTGTEIELEGIIDRFNPDQESVFDVNGVTVDAGSAEIVGESDAAPSIQRDAEVEVEGSFNSAGILVARRVEVELEDNVEIVARVANDPGPGGPVEFFNAGGLERLLNVAITPKTRLRDKSDNPMDNFSVAHLAQNDWVELDAFEDAAGKVTALKIERFTPETPQEASVEAMIDEIEPMSGVLQVLGTGFCRRGSNGGCDQDFDISEFSAGDEVELEWVDDGSFGNPHGVDSMELDD